MSLPALCFGKLPRRWPKLRATLPDVCLCADCRARFPERQARWEAETAQCKRDFRHHALRAGDMENEP